MLDRRFVFVFGLALAVLIALAILTRKGETTMQIPAPIQTGSGTAGPSDTTVNGTWTGATTAGNFLVAVVTCTNNAAITSITPPSGWSEALFVANGALAFRAVGIYFKPNAASETTTGDFTVSGDTAGACIVMAEYSGVGAASPFDQAAEAFTDVNSATFDSGTTGTTAQADELLICGYATGSGAHNNDPTNSFAIVAQVENTGVGGTNRATMTARIVSATGTYSSALTGISQKWAAGIATFKAEGHPAGRRVGGVRFTAGPHQRNQGMRGW